MSGEWRGAAVALLAAAAVTVIMAAPVLVAPTERIFGSATTFAREDPNRDPLVVIDQLRTGHVPAPYLQPLTDLPGRMLARVLGPVAAYNAIVLVTFPLAAAAAYLLARHVVGSHPGALVAALAFAFLPFHVAHATNHPHVAQTQWIPLYFLALGRCFDRPDVRRVALLLAASAAVVLSNFYGGLIAIVLGPVALAADAIAAPRGGEGRLRRLMVAGLAVVAVPAALLLLVRVVAPALLARPEAFAFPRSDLFLHAARWWSYVVPPVDHPLMGAWARRIWEGSGVESALLEQQVGMGWSLLALAIVPLWLRVRGDRTSLAARGAPVLAMVALAAFACSLSPEGRIGPLTTVRPSAILYEVLPMFRAYARFGVVVGLMVALLAGGGAAWLLARPTPAGRRAAIVLLVLAALEQAPLPPWRWRDVLPTRAHRWLAARPGSLRVLDCVAPARVSDRLAGPLLGHEVSLLGAPGFDDDCGMPRIADMLRARGYTHMVVRAGMPSGRWLMDRVPDGLARGPAFADSAILEVSAAPPVAYVDEMAGFYPREYAADATWRWMGRRGTLTVVAPAAGEAVLEIALQAFPEARRVEWLVNERPLGDVEVPSGWRTCTLPLGPLSAGKNVVTLTSRTPAVLADGILHNGDRRAIAVAVGEWRIYLPAPLPISSTAAERHAGARSTQSGGGMFAGVSRTACVTPVPLLIP